MQILERFAGFARHWENPPVAGQKPQAQGSTCRNRASDECEPLSLRERITIYGALFGALALYAALAAWLA